MHNYTEVQGDTTARSVKKQDSDISFIEVVNGTVLPWKEIPNSPKYGAGGVLDSQLGYIVASGMPEDGYLQYGAKYEIDTSEIICCNEEVIWFGLFFKHWGHFLIELVSRMWYVIEHYKDQKIVYISHNDHIEDNFAELLGYIGIPYHKILRIDRHTRFKNIIIPDYAGTEFYHSDKYVKLFDTVVSNSQFDRNDTPVPSKIYFSRKNFFDSKWKDFGEKEIEEAFISNGYEATSPEQLNLKSQIAIWNNAKSIICVNGTIPMNLVFCRSKLDLVVLNKTRRRHENLFSLQKTFHNFPITYIDVYYPKYAHLVTHMGSGPFLMYKSPFLIDYFKDHHLRLETSDIRSYPLKAELNILRFKYFNYYKYLSKVRNLKKRLFHK